MHEGKHLCSFCGKLCKHESSLNAHLRRHQGIFGLLEYINCDFDNTNAFFLEERQFKCDPCGKSYFSRNGLIQHQVTAHAEQKPNAKFLCSVCGKGFTTNQRLQIHTFVHTGERNYACDLCSRQLFYLN